jgi:mono/diheme cytochrome c family protein
MLLVGSGRWRLRWMLGLSAALVASVLTACANEPLESGVELYEAHCALCHGPDRRAPTWVRPSPDPPSS